MTCSELNIFLSVLMKSSFHRIQGNRSPMENCDKKTGNKRESPSDQGGLTKALFGALYTLAKGVKVIKVMIDEYAV
jgi:hypothetical protein